MIESSSNGQIKYILHLKKNARFRRKEKKFLVEGYKMVREALERDMAEKMYLAVDCDREKLGPFDVPYEEVSNNLFREISDTTTPQGVMAIVRMPYYILEEYLDRDTGAFLCLEDINDPGNLGTMLRTSEGAGMTGVILSKNTVDPFNPKVVRATMGAMFRVPIFFAEDFADTMNRLKEHKYKIFAAHLHGKQYYYDEDYSGRVAIMIGNEANGLSDLCSEIADCKVKIPMKGQLESLNAAVSAALFMYEVMRNRL